MLTSDENALFTYPRSSADAPCLRDALADLNTYISSPPPFFVPQAKWTPLHRAVKYRGHEAVFQVLLKAGAKVDAEDKVSSR